MKKIVAGILESGRGKVGFVKSGGFACG